MRLADTYSINVRYQRATRIDNDLSEDFFPGLVFHGTAENTLRTLGKQYAEGRQRAFTVTGPYGTGKSTVALLLAGYLHHDQKLRKAATNCVGAKFDKELSQHLNVNKGWLIVRVVGGIGNPIVAMWLAIQKALTEHPATKGLAKKYKVPSKAPSSSELEACTEKLFKELSGKVDGVLFMLDEMGKTVEHFIRHDKDNAFDMQFFQNFVELFSGKNALFIGFLHQAFGEYAKSRGKAIQEEWSKIQGRYSDLNYNVSEDETVALIAQSIESKSGRSEVWANNKVKKVCKNLQRTTLRESKVLHNRLEGCFPLHPSVALLLGPISKRSFSQNERSTFSFLNSREPNSFHSFLEEHDGTSHDTYQLFHLWDYLESNLEHHIISTIDGHAWVVAREAIVRTSNHSGHLHRQVIKTIAMLNLFGRHLGMYASDDVLGSVFDHVDPKELEECLQDLKQQSTVTFRKHLNAWAVFEGSDFDLEDFLELQRSRLQHDDTWTTVLEYQQFTIAKRHYHEKGTLRWLEQRIALTVEEALAEKWKSKQGAFGSFLLLADETSDSSAKLEEFSNKHKNCAVGVSQDIEPLKSAARELLALQQIVKDTPELQHDPIASKEYEVRYGNATKELDHAYEKTFNNAQWWFDGAKQPIASLNVIASSIADEVFPCTPQIFNELINRKKPSGTSNSARRKLMEQMISFSDEENLGLNEGFPPEKAIYLSCLKQTGLHTKQSNGEYSFVRPEGSESKNLQLMFNATEEMINESSELVTLADIYKMWEEKPYGLTSGLCPVIALAYLMSRDEELAYYDKDSTAQYVYIPEIDNEFVNKMMRAPKEVGVRYFEVSGVKHHYIHSFARIASDKLKKETTPKALNVARNIVTFVHTLKPWVKSSREIDPGVKKFRDAVLRANDPYKLLFEDLYDIFNLKNISSDVDADKLLDSSLSRAIEQLRTKHDDMLNSYKKILNDELGEFTPDLVERCQKVLEVSGDSSLRNFSRQLAQCLGCGNRWLEKLIGIVSSTPDKDWNDSVLARGRQELFNFCQNFIRVETYIAASQGKNSSTAKSIALVVSGGDQPQQFVRQVNISEHRSQAVEQLKSKLGSLLDKHSEEEKTIVLHELLQQCLIPHKSNKDTSEAGN